MESFFAASIDSLFSFKWYNFIEFSRIIQLTAPYPSLSFNPCPDVRRILPTAAHGRRKDNKAQSHQAILGFNQISSFPLSSTFQTLEFCGVRHDNLALFSNYPHVMPTHNLLSHSTSFATAKTVPYRLANLNSNIWHLWKNQFSLKSGSWIRLQGSRNSLGRHAPWEQPSYWYLQVYATYARHHPHHSNFTVS